LMFALSGAYCVRLLIEKDRARAGGSLVQCKNEFQVILRTPGIVQAKKH
jgi:hypothetical protein